VAIMSSSTKASEEIEQLIPSGRPRGATHLNPQPSRIVGIDPGMRDMIVCVSNQGDEPLRISMKSMRQRCFTNAYKRTRALDVVCRRILGGQRNTIIAFGNGIDFSTDSALGQLHNRLATIHGAKVVWVDEYMTSQLCSRCHKQLLPVTVTNKTKSGCKIQLQPCGIRRCGTCRNDKGAPLYWNRDINAAWNILNCYVSESTSGSRPSAFHRALG
jgi:transposase